jgi:iron complex outermembrane receptor protein
MKNSIRRILVGTLTVGCGWLVAAGQSFAQEASGGEQSAEPKEKVEEEITVTARQVEERLVDVPASISVMTIEQIESVGVERAQDFIKVIPGVSIVAAAEVGDTQVNIRGINGSRDAETSFAFILDGILMTNPAAFNREYGEVRQVEVLKGPQGAYYGRNAEAGAVIVTTERPGDARAGKVDLSAGEDQSYSASATVGGPLGSRSSRFQLHGDWRTTDGFYTNSFLKRDVADDYEGYNLSGRLLLGQDDHGDWDFKLRYGKVEAAAITFNAAFALPTFASVLQAPAFFENVNDHAFVFQANIDPKNDQEAFELSARGKRQFAWGELSAWGLYSDIQNAFYADGTSGAFGFFAAEPTCIASTAAAFGAGVKLPPPQFLGPTPASSLFGPYSPTTCDGTQYQVRNQKDLSFEARLTGNGSKRLRWQTGVYYLNIDREVGVNLGIDKGLGVTEKLFVPANGSNPTEQLVHDNFKTDVGALFGSLFYDLRDDLEVSVALRYDREKRKVHNLVPVDARTQYVDFTLDGQYSGGAPLNPGLEPSLNPLGRIPDKSKTFSELQPKVSVTWQASDSLNLFANWGVGFKSGGFNNQGSKATVDLFINTLLGADLVIEDQFRKETSSSYEVGFKTDTRRRFSVNTALYKVNVDDMQFFEFLVGPFGLLRVVSNIDRVDMQGAEVGLKFRATDRLEFDGGYSFTDSEIKKNTSRPATVGNESPYTPAYTANLSAFYSRPLGNKWVLSAGVNGTRVGETWFHTVQNEKRVTIFNAVFPGLGIGDYSRARRDPFTLLDARIGVSSERLSFTLYGKNLGDEKHLEEVIVAPEFGGSFIHPGSQRRIGVEVGIRF